MMGRYTLIVLLAMAAAACEYAEASATPERVVICKTGRGPGRVRVPMGVPVINAGVTPGGTVFACWEGWR
jgi:hypothetical protein